LRRRRGLVVSLLVASGLVLPSGAAASPGWVTPIANLSAAFSTQATPQIASDARGDTAVAWVDPATSDVFVSKRPAGGAFSVDSAISTASGQELGSIAIDSSGLVYVFFVTGSGAASTVQPNVATEPIGGSSWTVTPLASTSASNPPGAPLVGAVSPSGKALAVWYQGNTSGNQLSKLVSATKAAGSTVWSTGVAVAGTGDQGNSTSPGGPLGLALDPSGDAALVFDRFDSGFSNRLVWGTTLTAGAAAWTTANTISTDSASDTLQAGPFVAIDNNGTATAAWTRNNNAPNNIVQFATKTLSATSWPAAPNGTSSTAGANDLSPLGSDASQPSMVIEPDGTTTIAWTESTTTVEERTRPAAGGAFNGSTTLPNTLTGSSAPDLVGAPDGSIVALWSGFNGASTVGAAAHRAVSASTFSSLPGLPGTGNSSILGASDDQGNVAATWINDNAGNFSNQATGLVVGPPIISNVSFPGTATAGTPFSYSATVTDRWTTATSSWNFGDSTTGVLNGTKTFASAGVFHPTLTATDPFGNTASASSSITVRAPAGPPAPGPGSALAPALAGLSVSPRAFLPAASGASVAKKAKTGATVSYRDSQTATTTLTVSQAVRGVRKGKKCVAAPRHPKRGAKRCSLTKTLGSFKHADIAGRVSFHFTGRVGHHRLAAGSYTLTAFARNPAGRSSAAVRATFTIKRR